MRSSLLALSFFLPLFHRNHAAGVASLTGCPLGIPFLAIAYARVYVTVNLWRRLR